LSVLRPLLRKGAVTVFFYSRSRGIAPLIRGEKALFLTSGGKTSSARSPPARRRQTSSPFFSPSTDRHHCRQKSPFWQLRSTFFFLEEDRSFGPKCFRLADGRPPSVPGHQPGVHLSIGRFFPSFYLDDTLIPLFRVCPSRLPPVSPPAASFSP